MLGENGAGKTTTISMLTGLFPPDEGYALVGGYNIVGEIDKVHIVMGLCPQFDILWDDLSCKEHLLFYARMKGVPSQEEDRHVRSLLEEVGLYEERNRYSSQLSGGMKRRYCLD
jgi:ABC-type multidrug transport system ATPase subunit